MTNMIAWFSIPSTDFDRAVKFYETIFDLKMDVHDADDGGKYAMFPGDPHKDVLGGITQDPTFAPSDDGVRVYLNANGVMDDVLARIPNAGGEVLTPKTSMGEMCWYAIFRDTEGSSIAMYDMA